MPYRQITWLYHVLQILCYIPSQRLLRRLQDCRKRYRWIRWSKSYHLYTVLLSDRWMGKCSVHPQTVHTVWSEDHSSPSYRLCSERLQMYRHHRRFSCLWSWLVFHNRCRHRLYPYLSVYDEQSCTLQPSGSDSCLCCLLCQTGLSNHTYSKHNHLHSKHYLLHEPSMLSHNPWRLLHVYREISKCWNYHHIIF